MKYKVGDRVRIVSKWVYGCKANSEGRMDKYRGTIMTVREVCDGFYHMVEDNGEHYGDGWHWFEPAIAELVSKVPITKQHLKNGDIVKFENGGVGCVITEHRMIITTDSWINLDNYKDDLTSKVSPRYNIQAVRRPRDGCECRFDAFDENRGELVYDRERDTVVEMTMEEICAALGKTIKIVKE